MANGVILADFKARKKWDFQAALESEATKEIWLEFSTIYPAASIGCVLLQQKNLCKN